MVCGAQEDRGPIKKHQDFIFSDRILLASETRARKPALLLEGGRVYPYLWFYTWYIYAWPRH